MTTSAKEYSKLLEDPRLDEIAIKIKEKCIYRLVKIKIDSAGASGSNADATFRGIMELLQKHDPFLGNIPKAKTAKIVRSILDIVSKVPDSLDIQVSLCRDIISWCVKERRTFLKQRIEARLAQLLLETGAKVEALKLSTELLVQLRKLDDKQMLTETHLTESRIYFDLQNMPKSKASLTAARTAANSIYVTPFLQAELDELSGMLQLEEGDASTAYSYFYEAFEAYDSISHPRAQGCFKNMLLTKVVQGSAKEVPALLSSPHGLKHAGVALEAMAAVASAAKERSLDNYKSAVAKPEYAPHLRSDPLIARHIDALYEKMFEINLLKLITPFARVEIDHLATLIGQSEGIVERKLSQMILDRTLNGILDQGAGHLIVHDDTADDPVFRHASDVVEKLSSVVDALHVRAKNAAGAKGRAAIQKQQKDAKTAKDEKEGKNVSKPKVEEKAKDAKAKDSPTKKESSK
jgi:26S proteasome regulatory subunit N6